MVLRPVMPSSSAETPLLFRFRVIVFFSLYALGFLAPWARYGSGVGGPRTMWLALAGWGAASGLVSLQMATVTVTCIAIACALGGASLRIWGTAYLGAGVMRDPNLCAEGVVAAGPYRFMRNPLYVGSLLTCLSVTILMPVSGAAVCFLGSCVLIASLIRSEEAYLAHHLGSDYLRYKHKVPAIVPALHAGIARSAERPRWLQSIVSEIFQLGYALCLLVLAWQYNVNLLLRCMLVCFGVSLVARGLLGMGRQRYSGFLSRRAVGTDTTQH